MDENGLGLSSPDPLGNSSSNLQYSSPTKRKSEQYTPKKPLADTNGNVRLQDFYLNPPPAFISGTSSPTKTTAEAENLISPWRIRVVVEAEREDGKENPHQSSISLTKQLTQRTTTTIVPLKHAHEPSPATAKRGRGRPRKSLDSPITRTVTPKPRKTGRRKTRGDSVGEHSEMDASMGVTPPKRGRGRPRKSVDTNIDDLWLVSGKPIDEDQTLAASHVGDSLTRENTTRRKIRGRRKAMTPVKSTASQDSSSQVEEVNGSNHGGDLQQDNSFSRQKDTKPQRFQSHSSPPPSSANHQGTKEVTMSKDALPDELHNSNVQMDPTDENEEFDSILESEGFSIVSISSVPSAQQHLSSPVESRQAVQSEASEARSGIMQANQAGNLRTNVPSDGQPSSSRKLRNPLLQQLSAPEQSSILSHMASSPPILNPQFQTEAFRQRQTPSLIPYSPSLPPPQQSVSLSTSPRSLDKPTDGTPKLARVVRTGIALQGVLSPAAAGGSSGSPVQQRFSSSSSAKSPKERLDDLFSGFSAGTRRELRAGLRFGEELAKNQAGRRISPKQEPTQAANSFSTAAEDMDVFIEDASLAYPSLPAPDEKEEYALSLPGSRQIEYPTIPSEQLLSPARSAVTDMDDRMSWKADTPVKSDLSPPKSTEDAVPPEMSCMFHEDTMILNWKAEWQREREAVSKQIQSASESQVIVIHSDDSEVTADADQFEVTDEDEVRDEEEMRDEEEAEEDIWQAEAHSSDPALEATPEVSEVLFQEEVVKPRRSKLPSPWRRNSEVVYSDEVLQDESDLFWQPNKRPQSNRARQRQEPSNISVLSEYVSRERSQHLTPKKSKPAPSPATEQEPSTYEVEEESFVEEVADDETILEASPISDEASQTSEPSEASGHSTTEAFISQPASSPPPTQPIPLPPQPTSWFSRLTSLTLAPIRLASLASTYLLPASNTPSLHPSLPLPSTPLSPYNPWTHAHWLALDALYQDSKLHPEHYAFDPRGRAEWLLGIEVSGRTSGWARSVDEVWCGIVEGFLGGCLANKGKGVGGAREERGNGGDGEREVRGEGEEGKGNRKSTGLIGEKEVVTRVFGLWVTDVKRGVVEWEGPRGK